MTWRAVRRRLWPPTIRVRVTLLATVLVAVPMGAAVTVAALFLRDSLLRDAREATAAAADQSAIIRGKEFTTCDVFEAGQDREGVSSQILQYCEPTSLSDWTPWLGTPRGGSLSLWPWTDPAHGPRPFRLAAIGDLNVRTVIYTVNPMQHEQAELNTLIRWSCTAMAVVTSLVAASAWFAAGRVLGPMEAIRVRFTELSAHHLDRRVPVPRGNNEITRLARTMNTTLDRLHSAVEQQRRFTADASHELRTPLAALRAELEIALAQPEHAVWPQVVRGAIGDTMRLQQLTTDLLLLARLDANSSLQPPSQPVDLTELMREEAARRRPPAHLTLTVTPSPGHSIVDGHPALLARVLGNLLDNAERHATHTITVSLTHDSQRHQAVLEVLDDGPGIPAEDRTRVFERFTRLDDARTQHSGGTGLGLAIAYHITTLHRGTLKVARSNQGARLVAYFPTIA